LFVAAGEREADEHGLHVFAGQARRAAASVVRVAGKAALTVVERPEAGDAAGARGGDAVLAKQGAAAQEGAFVARCQPGERLHVGLAQSGQVERAVSEAEAGAKGNEEGGGGVFDAHGLASICFHRSLTFRRGGAPVETSRGQRFPGSEHAGAARILVFPELDGFEHFSAHAVAHGLATVAGLGPVQQGRNGLV
jgi:hypothetical protein